MTSWVHSTNQRLIYQPKINFNLHIYNNNGENPMIISVNTKEAFDKVMLLFMIFKNNLSQFGIEQNLPPFVIFLKAS